MAFAAVLVASALLGGCADKKKESCKVVLIGLLDAKQTRSGAIDKGGDAIPKAFAETADSMDKLKVEAPEVKKRVDAYSAALRGVGKKFETHEGEIDTALDAMEKTEDEIINFCTSK